MTQSYQPRKQRLARYNAPQHRARKQMASHLSEELLVAFDCGHARFGPDLAPARCIDLTCRTLGAAGAACATTTECTPGNVCSGALCVASVECDAGGSCGYGTTCAAAGMCEPQHPSGGVCTVDAGCFDGLYCEPATMTCGAAPAIGSSRPVMWFSQNRALGGPSTWSQFHNSCIARKRDVLNEKRYRMSS